MLSIENLHANINGTPILQGLNLKVGPGEVHAIMGPNGAGKSTFAKILAGDESYEVTAGSAQLGGEEIMDLDPEERASKGLFLGFQYPVELPGVTNSYFLRTALNAQRKSRGEDEIDAYDFLKALKANMALLEMDATFKGRFVNVGFSGGEKKRNEILQLLTLKPRLAILDETDLGLDIDALRVVAKGVNSLRSSETSFVVVTHYQRLLDYIVPDFVHVLVDGKIVRSGDKSLALELEANGYAGMGAEA
jgi:Fe-S cluster assembly ATP-binding protein